MKRAGINWLSPGEAIRAIVAAQDSGVPLLGFDAAYLRAQETQPSMDDSRDYSTPAYSSILNTYADAIQFISERGKSGLHFEIVLGPQNSK